MAINAGDTAFQRYKSGVAQTSVQGSLSHAITVLGWGTMDGVKYWLVQNRCNSPASKPDPTIAI